MKYFLAKTDPQTYSISDLRKDKKTVWDGVHSSQAIIFIKTMKVNDKILIYHSMGNPAIVGMAKVISNPRDANEERRSWVVDVEYLTTFETPLLLRTIKDTNQFNDWSLIRQSRLSTMPVPQNFLDWMTEIGYIL